MNIVISAGGTGGHIYPALSIINKLKKEDKNVKILYIGTHNRMEKDIVPAMNIPYEAIEIYGLSKKHLLKDVKNVFLVKKAIKKCEKLISDFKADVVIGVGGYVTLPVILAAKKLGVKTVLHEQNSIPGKTNRFLASKADLVCISYQNSAKYFLKAKKVIYTGNPCGENALENKSISKNSLGLKKDKKLVLIVSGSLGSATINNFFNEYLSLIEDDENYEVLYITGKDYYEDFIKNKSYSQNVHIIPYLDNLSGLFKNTDLIISRAGAGTISEILATETVSILIPSPYVAQNHQYFNALDLKEKGVSILIEEKDLDANKLYITVKQLLENDNKEYKKMKENLKGLDMKNASNLICKQIKEMYDGKF